MQQKIALICLLGLVAAVSGQGLRPQADENRVGNVDVIPIRGSLSIPTSRLLSPVSLQRNQQQQQQDREETTTDVSTSTDETAQTIVGVRGNKRYRTTTESTTDVTDDSSATTTDSTTDQTVQPGYNKVDKKYLRGNVNNNIRQRNEEQEERPVAELNNYAVRDQERRYKSRSRVSSRNSENVKSYQFAEDFETLINPANAESEWKWVSAANHKAVSDISNERSMYDNFTANAGSFLRDNKTSTTVDLISLPFPQPIPPTAGRVAVLANYKAALINKKTYRVEEQQSLVVNFTFSCQLFNIKDQPYPKKVSSDPENDPTLGNCEFVIASPDAALAFGIEATDKGIWGFYGRNYFTMVKQQQSDQRMFVVRHSLAKRQSPYQLIDAAIVYDRANAVVNYYINNRMAWSVDNLGKLNPETQPEAQLFTQDRPDLQQVVVPKTFQVAFGLANAVDQPDPNSPRANTFGSRVVQDPNFYDPKAKFYDEEGKSMYNVWGQGASMTLKEANIAVV